MNYLLSTVYATLLLTNTVVVAANVEISNTPLANTGPLQAKPNIMFILDDSWSMNYEWLPDEVINTSNTVVIDPDSSTVTNYKSSKNCYSNYLHNKIYYNPSKSYVAPLKYDGTSFTDATYPNAKTDGYSSSSSTTNLSTWYYHNADASVTSAACANNNKYTKVNVSTLTAAQKTNFANWFSYYRKRSFLTRAAVSLSFSELTDKYRVGFTNIHDTSATSSTFLGVSDFNSAQKQDFYNKLFNSSYASATPLRSSLSFVGRYYANKLDNQVDPMQYSCQKNFTILSTDGYWNGNGGKQLNGTSDMDNQDGTGTARPYLDSSNKSDTLADTAMYYYKNDLRTSSLNNCTGILSGENVCTNSLDPSHEVQRMQTYTLGLGLSGTLAYVKNYDDPAQGDYLQIQQGTKNWPDPIENTTTARIDDLWHAAVNGRGKYYSADNAQDMAESLSDALTQIQANTGSSSAAATSNLEPVAGDNFVYVALYRTGDWYGDLLASTIDITTGAVSLKLDTNGNPTSGTYQWSAQTQLDTKASANSDTRNIYIFDSSESTKLDNFQYTNLSSAQKLMFDNLCSGTFKLTQCTNLSTSDKTLANAGTNVVNFLRGHNQYENGLFRDRSHLLGDIVNATPIYVKLPPFQYTEDDYSAFITAQKNRVSTVYAAANDGMLHAFDGTTGQERWAYIPSMVMNNLYKLADNDYSNNHQYFVDASPTVADVLIGSTWKTILVGGLNAGGRGLYALDVTDPQNPKGLWEFTNDNMGYSFGNPIVTRLETGEWVVIVSSGLNNTSPGDGVGRLFVLNVADGSLRAEMPTGLSTGVGDTTTPSGLGKLNIWVENPLENKVDRVYGGDMLGNVWRFDINNTIATTGREAVKVAELKNDATQLQPITVKPELAKINNRYIVLVSTGRYLGSSDISDTRQNTIYAFKDDSLSTGLGNLRARADIVEQTLSDSVDAGNKPIRTITNNSMDWSAKSGWYVDLISTGERVNVEMQLQYNTLTLAGNVPGNSNACTVSGGYAWLYHFDITDGSYVSTSTNSEVGKRINSNALIAGIKTIKLPNGRTVSIVTDTGGNIKAYDDPTPTGSAAGTAKRTSWREIIN